MAPPNQAGAHPVHHHLSAALEKLNAAEKKAREAARGDPSPSAPPTEREKG